MNLFNNGRTVTCGVMIFGGFALVVSGVLASAGWPAACVVGGILSVWIGTVISRDLVEDES